MLGRDASSHLHHTTSKNATKFKISGDTRPGRYEQWHLDFLLLLKGRQALSWELTGASFLSGHQHLCCHQIVRPKHRKAFDEWAAKEAPELVGAHRLMLGTDGKLLPIGLMDPWKKENTEQLDTAVSTCVIATTAAADEIADEDRGPGSSLNADRSHAQYCAIHSRHTLERLLQEKPSFLVYVPISEAHQ